MSIENVTVKITKLGESNNCWQFLLCWMIVSFSHRYKQIPSKKPFKKEGVNLFIMDGKS